MNRSICALVAIFSTLAVSAAADVPKSICVQGYLETPTSQPVSEPVCFEICVFDAPTNGNAVWCTPTTQPVCANVENGLFALAFGDSTLGSEDFGGPRWLEFRTAPTAQGPFETMSPRVELRTAPYAFRVGFVDNPELTNAIEADLLKLGDTTPGTAGVLRAFNGQSPNQETITLDGYGNGNTSGNGRIQLNRGDSTRAVEINADNGLHGSDVVLMNTIGTSTVELGAGAQNNGYLGGYLDLFDGVASTNGPTVRIFSNDSFSDPPGGGALHVFNGQSPNQETITLDGNFDSGDGRITMRDSSNNEILSMTPRGTYGRASLEMKDTSGNIRVDLGVGTGVHIPNSYLRLFSPNPGADEKRRVNLEGGDPNGNDGGSVQCFSAAGVPTTLLYGDNTFGGGSLSLASGQMPAFPYTIRLDGYWPGASGARVALFNANGTETMTLDANRGSGAGQISLSNASNQVTVFLDGENGDCCIRGTITQNGGCDLAESFDLADRKRITPGMVLVIDDTLPGRLRISTAGYDKKVAGIVSGAGGLKPGVVLGGRADESQPGAAESQHGNSDLPIALSGRVYCYVDTMGHAIEVGDLLTTADTPGYAMKAVDRERAFGAVLGKALEPLPKGKKGLILVLVALQ